MEIYERIRILRKKHLKMSMESFGGKLGVSRDTINNIELNRLARPDQKMSLYKLICSTFNVNEEWLLNGVEPMFVQPSAFSLDNLADQASPIELEFIKAYFELDPNIRKTVVDHFASRLSSAFDPDSQESAKAKIDREVEAYRADLELEARQASLVSDTPDEKEA